MYDQGVDLQKDDSLALYWYRESAAKGYTDAQFALAQMFAAGQGIPADQVEALKWFRKAAKANHAGAQYNLGTYMAHGTGTAKDLPEAAYWLSLAASQGHEHAVANRDYVLKLLTETERVELDRRLQTANKLANKNDEKDKALGF